MINGFITINKPSGITSNKVLGIVKHYLREIGITDKLGHMGTLDPIATGVLPIAIGRATRLFDYSLDKIKIYEAEFLFGAFSESLDADTEITKMNFTMPEKAEIEVAIESILGTYGQIPPQYSAKSVDGVRAYKLARRGEYVELKPKTITVYSCDVISIKGNTAKMKISCSGGTYIRAIGRDIAEKLGTKAVMTKLNRIQSGTFSIDESITLSDIENDPSCLSKKIIGMEKFLKDFPRIEIDPAEKKTILDGKKIKIDVKQDVFYVVNCEGVLCGIGYAGEDSFKMKTWLL
ncbi:MAG: tRNA pseudouridine(55) synthase TruB [Clostridia bacterium]|nr:tRNA pseudouridine(55) synthase TruB [Clostridia bacterium]